MCCVRGIEQAKAVVLTESTTSATSMRAHRAPCNPHLHAVVRVFDEDFGGRMETLLTDAVTLSASAIAAPGFVTAILDDEQDERDDRRAGPHADRAS